MFSANLKSLRQITQDLCFNFNSDLLAVSLQFPRFLDEAVADGRQDFCRELHRR